MEVLQMEITFKDGKKAALDTDLNIKKLMFINRDFNTDEIVTISFNSKGGQDFNLITAYKAVYLAYRQANMNDHVSWDSFTELWERDDKLAFEVYAKLIGGKSATTKFQESFKPGKN